MRITPEFREILEHLCQDITLKQIATKLGIPETTLNNRLRVLYRGLRVGDRDEAAAWARSNGYGQERQGALPFHKLRLREIEVVQHLAEGKSTKDIAGAMKISEIGVQSHLAEISRRLNENNRYEIVKAYRKLKTPPSIKKEMLTPMLRKILETLCQDLTNGQIATQLFLSEETVRTHLRRLYKALGVKDRNEAIAWGRKNGYSQTKPKELPFASLPPVELAVVELVAQGKTNKEISTILKCSETTAKRYLGRAAKRLKENNRGRIAAAYNQFKKASPRT